MALDPDKRNSVINAFQPDLPIEIPAKFAGRRPLSAQRTDALHAEGSCLVIYGERGLGKSSLAAQIERIDHYDTDTNFNPFAVFSESRSKS